MKYTGRTELIQGHKLYEGADHYWYDISGNRFDIANNKLYREPGPGKWALVRRPEPRPECVVLPFAPSDAETFKW